MTSTNEAPVGVAPKPENGLLEPLPSFKLVPGVDGKEQKLDAGLRNLDHCESESVPSVGKIGAQFADPFDRQNKAATMALRRPPMVYSLGTLGNCLSRKVAECGSIAGSGYLLLTHGQLGDTHLLYGLLADAVLVRVHYTC